MIRRSALLASAMIALPEVSRAGAGPAPRIGRWSTTPLGLPCYRHTGALPAGARDRGGADAQEMPDPAFLLGNHRITVFAHASGILQVLTGERAWARVNAAEAMNYGVNAASLTVNGEAHELVGIETIAADPSRTQRTFGCGFARYEHRLSADLSVRRIVSVAPSRVVGTGNAALVVSITVTNRSRRALAFIHEERLGTSYVAAGEQRLPPDKRTAHYASALVKDEAASIALSQTTFTPRGFSIALDADDADLRDRRPSHCFMMADTSNSAIDASVGGSTDAALAARFAGEVPARGTATFHAVIGLTYGDTGAAAAQARALLAGIDAATIDEGLFAAEWRAHLPSFPREPDPVFRTEMVWNAHALEAMATYAAYFDETFVPQGTVYSYEDGENISNRDHLQALLPLCYTNPALAKSCLRHVFKQTSTLGEIKRGTGGYGYIPPSIYKESDEQLYLFMALGEYLRATGDHAFLDETLSYYPRLPGSEDSALRMIEKYFVYLRDEVGIGPNGLVRILNSDWSDSFFHAYSPNATSGSAESHLNSAMALAVLPVLVAELTAAGRADAAPLIAAIEAYRASLHEAYMKDLGERDFSARAYLNDGKPRYGVDVVCLEPQGWLLQIPGLPIARKRAIYARVHAATFAPEKVGFRIRERPIFGGRGEGEDGGIWFAIEHQMLAGVASFDKAEARRLLATMSFDHHAQRYPDYTLGRWTHSDSLQSTLSDREGLINYWRQSYRVSAFGYCSHAHSWPLYNYLRIVA